MTYATLDQLTDRYGTQMLVALTDRADVATGMIDTDVIDRALTDTDAVIDSYLAARYQLPLVATPDLVADLAQAIAIYKLHVSAADPKIEADYKDAMRTLREVAAGTVRLPIEGKAPKGSGGGEARTTDRPRPFTAKNLTGYI